jgi:hypothetical protein
VAGHVRATKNFEIFPKDSASANCESHSSMGCTGSVMVYAVYPHFYTTLYLNAVKQGIILPRRVKILFLTLYFSVGALGSNVSTTHLRVFSGGNLQKISLTV